MEELFIYMLKSAGVLSIFVLIYHFLLRKLTFFKANRFFLLFGLLASIVFPLIEITQTVYVEQPQMILLPQQMPMVFEQPPVEESIIDGGQLFMMLYAAISLFLLGKMTVELLSLRRLILSGTRRIEDGFIRISLSRKVTPFSFFNYICFNENDESDPTNDLILKHEQVHAREWHSIDLLITHIYCALFWINPLAWLLKRQVGENLEFIADATAKVQNKTGLSYERTLLSSAASHMQPALANNFFTPFIKKRIQMLQKETSKNWNAYKYALILPVIIVFLYSFNVVEHVEYVKSDSSNLNSSTGSEPLVFDITVGTTASDLAKFANKINEFADFKMDLKWEETDGDSQTINVYTAFENQELFKSFSMEMAQSSLLLIEVSKDQVKTYNTLTKETIIISNKGSIIGDSEPLLFKDLAISLTGPKKANYGTSQVNSNKIKYTIPATASRESLERIKTQLKADYNVDFNYSNLKYKDGKIISLKIDLNDNQGFKGSQNYKSSEPIEPICITGNFDGDSKSWNMGSCGPSRGGNNAIYYSSGSPTDERVLDSLRMTMRNFKSMNMDSVKTVWKSDLKRFNMDSLRSSMTQFRKFDIDSVRSQMNIARGRAYKRLDSARSNNLRRRFVSDSIVFEDDDINAYQPKYSAKTLNGGNPPLIIVNGKEYKGEMDDIDPNTIASVNVLKDESATALYGDKGKNGVVIITLKVSGLTIINKDGTYTVIDSLNAGKVKITNLKGDKAINTNDKLDLPENTYILLDGKPAKKHELEKVDPNDIESMTVLKGNDAIALYGKKAENGAIIIITKVNGESDNTSNTRSFTRSSTVTKVSYNVMIDNFTDAEFNKLKESLKKEGYDFNLRTLRKTGNKVTKLKFDLDGTAYTFEPNTGMKSLSITINDTDKEPKVSAVSY